MQKRGECILDEPLLWFEDLSFCSFYRVENNIFLHLTWQTSLVISSFEIQFSSVQVMTFLNLGVYVYKRGRLEMVFKVCSSILVLQLHQDPA